MHQRKARKTRPAGTEGRDYDARSRNPCRKAKQSFHDARDARGAGRAVNMELNNIIGFDPLYDSMRKCSKGVIWKDSTASYCLNAIERTINLSSALRRGTYKARPTVKFMVTSPKPREIASIAFRDRVFQRSLNDNAVYPVMSASFIYDNFACQKGKGTDAARKRLTHFLRRYYRKHGQCGYVAQFDISGYYPNMSHALTEELFRSKLPPEVYAMVERILREQYDGEYGYNPGSQLIQIAGISFLDGFDHFVKEKLHAKYYLRYMDDFIIIHHDREYLDECVRQAGIFLHNLEFELNPKKTRVYPLSEGVPFLGFRFFLTGTGKVLMLLKPENVKRQRRKLRRLVARSKRGLIPKEKVDESYAAWRNHAEKGDTFKLLQRMDAYYADLWRDEPCAQC